MEPKTGRDEFVPSFAEHNLVVDRNLATIEPIIQAKHDRGDFEMHNRLLPNVGRNDHQIMASAITGEHEYPHNYEYGVEPLPRSADDQSRRHNGNKTEVVITVRQKAADGESRTAHSQRFRHHEAIAKA